MRGWVVGLASACTVLGVGAVAFGCSDDDGASTSATNGPDGSVDGTSTGPNDGTTGDGSIGPTGSAPLEPGAAARAATFIASCISDDGVNRTLQEIYQERTVNPFRTAAVYACLASKTNGCAAVTECLGLEYGTDGGCGSDASCNGAVYQECSGASFRLSVDCARLGLECKPFPGAYCGTAAETACSGSAGTCEAMTAVACIDGVMRRGLDCAKLGAQCGGITPTCRGTGGACTGTSNDDAMTARWEGIRCENGKLVGCLQGGLSTLDCATSAVGFTCFDAPGGPATATAYCGSAAECTPRSPWDKVAATCDGTSVVMCNGGKIEKLDCKSLGFTGCANGLCTPGFL
jgi:hypothetical protein